LIDPVLSGHLSCDHISTFPWKVT